MKSSGFSQLLSSLRSLFRVAKGGSIVAAVTVLFSIVTVVLMSRANIDDAIQFREDLKNLYDFLHGAPLEDPAN